MCSSQLISSVLSSDRLIVDGSVVNGRVEAVPGEYLDRTETDEEKDD